jgi:hypothetical protein
MVNSILAVILLPGSVLGQSKWAMYYRGSHFAIYSKMGPGTPALLPGLWPCNALNGQFLYKLGAHTAIRERLTTVYVAGTHFAPFQAHREIVRQ